MGGSQITRTRCAGPYRNPHPDPPGTLLQAHLYQLPHFWSPGVPEKHYTGVALMVKRSSCWAAQELRWRDGDPCYPYWHDNRLLAAQIWLGNGGTSLLVYVVYGPSGARWEKHKRQYLDSLLDALGQDVAARGDLPVLILGDFNMVIAERVAVLRRCYLTFSCRR